MPEKKYLSKEQSQTALQSYPKGGRVKQADLFRLTEPGRRLEEYWRMYLPRMYNQMANEGTLLKTLQSQGQRLFDLMLQQMRNGLDESQAWELANEEIFSLKPENDQTEMASD